jgi:hypothetical protein
MSEARSVHARLCDNVKKGKQETLRQAPLSVFSVLMPLGDENNHF